MNKVLSTTATVAVLFTVVSLVAVLSQPVAAHDSKEAHSHDTSTPAKVTYSYVAQPGDTYSQFARKAVQTYGKKNKVNLSQAQIIFAETTLTLAAGSPMLVEDEKRSIDESAVKDVVEKAGKLTDAQKAAWAVYAQGVDFNTDKVGQK